MKVRGQIWMWTLGVVLALGLAAAPSRVAAQDKDHGDHVVSLDELKLDSAKPAETRQANEADVRHLLQTEAGQQALKQAKVDYANKEVRSLNTSIGIQADLSETGDPKTVLGYAGTSPAQNQQCTWVKRVATHPAFQQYKPVEVAPKPGEVAC